MRALLAAIGITALLAVSTAQAAFTYYLVSSRTVNGMNFCTYSNGGTYAYGLSVCPISITL